MTQGEQLLEERRLVTILFADLVGFTERAELLDPEDVRALLSRYYVRVRAELERHGGTVDKYIGDAVMAIFGAPVAHEDDPERAVRAALAIAGWARSQDDLRLRVGVNTGEALVALAGSPDGLGMVAGDVVNTAARLQAAAPPNGVLVGEPTFRATREVFAYRDVPPIEAKGKAEPVRVWEPLHSRVGVRGGRRLGQAPLVGRVREHTLLRAMLERVRAERQPQLVTLVGVPGIGKSRLVWEIRRQGGATWLEGRSAPYGSGTSFGALAEIVRARAAILETDPVEDAAAKLRRAIDAVVDEPSDALWLEAHLRTLVGLAADGDEHDDRRAEAFSAWRRFLEAVAESEPLALAFDDLHWADDALVEFVDELCSRTTGVPLLVVATARPELLDRRPDWGGTTLNVGPLSDEETMELVHQLAERLELPARTEDVLLARAAGNPLYAEEFARIATESPGRLEDGLPESIYGLIAARLDLLPRREKELLQDAAVIGSSFWLGALAQVGELDCSALSELLHGLERREFVRGEQASSVGGEPEYTFRHHLIRDVAYEQIPRARRAEKHRRAARWLEALPAEGSENRVELLAHHAVRALELARAAGSPCDDLRSAAFRALREAGDRARALYAHGAAAAHYARALELGQDEPATARAELSLALAEARLRGEPPADVRAELGQVVGVARASSRADLLARAALTMGGLGVTVAQPDGMVVGMLEEALAGLGSREPALRSRVLARLVAERFYESRPERRAELAGEAVRLAHASGAAEAIADALTARRIVLWTPAYLDERLALARELVALAEQMGDRERLLQGRSWLVADLGEVGELDAARAEVDAYAREADSLAVPAYLWWTPMWESMFALLEGRFDEAIRLNEEARAVGARANDQNAALYTQIQRFHIDVEQGLLGDSWLELVEAGLSRPTVAGAYTCGLAWAYAETGRLDEARATLDRLGPEGFAAVPFDLNWSVAAAEFTRAVGLLGDSERASAAYALLRPYAGRMLILARAAAFMGPVESHLGRLAATARDWEAAAAHFEAGLAACERLGARLMHARTRKWYDELLAARG